MSYPTHFENSQAARGRYGGGVYGLRATDVSLVSSSAEDDTDEDEILGKFRSEGITSGSEVSSGIHRFENVASYNWMDRKSPVILVPGKWIL
jgi:hypothetical protein